MTKYMYDNNKKFKDKKKFKGPDYSKFLQLPLPLTIEYRPL